MAASRSIFKSLQRTSLRGRKTFQSGLQKKASVLAFGTLNTMFGYYETPNIDEIVATLFRNNIVIL